MTTEITVLLPLDAMVSAGLMMAVDNMWPGATIKSSTGDRMVFVIDPDTQTAGGDDREEVHTVACTGDACPCYLSGRTAEQGNLAEANRLLLEAAQRLIEDLTRPPGADR